MRKVLLVILIVIAVSSLALVLRFSEGPGKRIRSFREAYSSAERLTFSIGKESVITWEEKVILSYGNKSSIMNRSLVSVVVRDLSWPDFEICPLNATTSEECGKVFFHMIAFPKELVGVDSITLPSLLYENLTVLMINEGLVELDTSWGRRGAFNYTNVTRDYLIKDVSSVTKLYVDERDGKVIRGEVSMMRGNVSITFMYLLTSEPDVERPFQIEKPEKWLWGELGTP